MYYLHIYLFCFMTGKLYLTVWSYVLNPVKFVMLEDVEKIILKYLCINGWEFYFGFVGIVIVVEQWSITQH